MIHYLPPHQWKKWTEGSGGTTLLLYFAFALVTISLALSAGTLMASAGTPYRLVPAHFYPCTPPNFFSLNVGNSHDPSGPRLGGGKPDAKGLALKSPKAEPRCLLGFKMRPDKVHCIWTLTPSLLFVTLTLFNMQQNVIYFLPDKPTAAREQFCYKSNNNSADVKT